MLAESWLNGGTPWSANLGPLRRLSRRRDLDIGSSHGDDLAVCLGAGAAVLVVLDLMKPLWRRLAR
jgi:hypothetical protein